MPESTSQAAIDRRRNLELRAIFEETYQRLLPFLDPAQSWGGVSLEYLAFRMIREMHPDLTPSEVQQLVVASVRVHRQRNRDAAGGQSASASIALPT